MTSPPVQSALKIPRGATWSAYWPVYNPNGSGTLLDLTGWSAVGQIRAWYGSTELLFAWPDDAAITCGADGKVTVNVGPAQSTAWTWERGVYGIELTNPGGDVIPLAMGPVLVTPEVVI